MWVDPEREGRRTFEGTLPMPCCEDDDGDELQETAIAVALGL